MEHIKNIEIKNFKSIRHQKIDDCRRINVFIGYPNTGKSNILEALGLFALDPIEAKIDFKELIRVGEDPSLFFNGLIANEIDISINSKNIILKGEYWNNELRIIKYWNKDKLLQLEDRMIMSIYKFKNFIFLSGDHTSDDIKKRFPLRIKKYEFKKYNIVERSLNFSSLDFPFGNNIFNIISTNRILKNEVQELFKNYNLRILFNNEIQALQILKLLSEDDIFTIPYSMIADTLQRLIFHKAAVLSNKETVLLFEEPEAHMFPPYIAKFTTDIIFGENNNQYFIASHSPYVLNEFIEEAQNDLAVYVVDYNKGETVIKRLSEDELIEIAQYGIDLFFNLESYLDKYGQPHST